MTNVADDEWVGTHLLFENDRVRIWDFKLAPGESSKQHTHKRDWLYVYVTEDNRMRIDYPQLPTNEASYPDGHVAFLELDKLPPERLTHTATNVGSKPHRQILIEFKKPDEAAG